MKTFKKVPKYNMQRINTKKYERCMKRTETMNCTLLTVDIGEETNKFFVEAVRDLKGSEKPYLLIRLYSFNEKTFERTHEYYKSSKSIYDVYLFMLKRVKKNGFTDVQKVCDLVDVFTDMKSPMVESRYIAK